MPLVGTFSTMSLPDLLQWLGSSGKTGTLQVERSRATKVIRLRRGRVIGCSSDHPTQRLGQFLISRKKITEEQLRQALTIKEETSQFLGQTLVEMGALSHEELCAELTAKVEEIIHSLFDWEESVFRFEETVAEEADAFPVDLRVDDILLRGLQRVDEMALIRSVLYDPGIVLRYTSKPPGPEIFGDETSRSMYGAIDGERTLADILLHMHGTEYQVKRFLYNLHENGYVEVAGVNSVAPETGGDNEPAAPPLDEPDLDLEPFEPDLAAIDRPAADQTPAGAGVEGESTTSAAVATESAPAAAEAHSEALSAELARTSRMMTDGELEGALDVLDALYKENPGDDALRRLTAEAEAAFVDKCYRHYLPAEKVPILTGPIENLSSEALSPQEYFLLSRIDGSWDIKSIIQVAPFREVEALRTLKRLREMEMIELCDPA
jgi:DNA-binding Xre family transcriptional regulator